MMSSGGAVTLGGLCMSRQEWHQLDERFRLEYLRALIETSPPRADEWAYESYEVHLEGRVEGRFR